MSIRNLWKSASKYIALSVLAIILTGAATAVSAADITVVKTANPDPVVNAGGTIHYTITALNSSSPGKTLTGVQIMDTLNSQLTLVDGSVHASPLGFNDTYDAVGNTPLLVASTNTLTTPGVFFSTTNAPLGVLANDKAFTDSIVLTAVNNAATSQGGVITLNSDGTFFYTPPVGFTGTDTYVYTIQNNVDSTLSDTATININVNAPRVWYVNNSGSNGDGRAATPFNALSAAQSASAAGDVIYVFTGTGSYTGGITLKANQELIGNGVTLAVNSFSLAAAGSPPTLTNSGGNGVTLATNNTVKGLNLGNCSGSAISGSSFGTLTTSSVSINTNGQALNLSTGTIGNSSAFGSVVSSGGTNNVLLSAIGGSLDMGTGALSGASGTALSVTGVTTIDLNYSGSISKTSSGLLIDAQSRTTGSMLLSGNLSSTGSGAAGINVASNSGGTFVFSGSTKTVNAATQPGVTLSSNTGSIIDFTNGGLAITTTTGTSFSATGGGTVTVSGANNTLSAGNGTALNVVNTTIGAANLNFKSISSSGGSATGIILDTTGATGGLIVNGDGADTSLGGNSSGGTISNKSGSDNALTTGCGIYLNSTSNVVLRRITINGTNQNFGIRGNLVNNFTLEYSTVSGTNGTAASLPTPENAGEGSVYFGNFEGSTSSKNGLTGSGVVTNCVFGGGRARNFSVINTSGSLNRLTITGSRFDLNQDFSDANQSLALEARQNGTVLNTTVTGSTFLGSPGDLGNFTGQTLTSMDVIFQNNVCSNAHAQNIIGGGGMTYATQGVMTFHVTGNSFQGADGSAITLQKAAGGSLFSGFIDSNTIGLAASANSGSKSGNGIFCSYAGTGTAAVTITNNQIHQIAGNFHISADNTGGSYTANFTIQGNTFDTPGSGWAAGIGMTNGSPASSDTVNVCAKIGGSTPGEKNQFDLNGGLGILVGSDGAASGHTFNLPGYTGSTLANVESFLLANNAGSFTTSAFFDAPATEAAFTGVGTGCATPASLLFSESETQAGSRAKQDCGCGVKQTDDTNTRIASATNVAEQTVYSAQIASSDIANKPAASLGFVTHKLTNEQLKPVVAAAIERWRLTGLTPEQFAVIKAVNFDVRPLAGWYLGSSSIGEIIFSSSAAGKGWYVSHNPLSDEDFSTGLSATHLNTKNGELPSNHLDLLTAVMHEMGHQLGLKDAYTPGSLDSIMFGYLTLGERRIPALNEALGAIPHAVVHGKQYLFTPINIGDLPAGKSVTVKFDVTVTATPTAPYSVSNTAVVSGTNITNSPVSSNTVVTTINVSPMAFSAQIPPSLGDVGLAYAGYTFVADGNPAPTYSLSPTSSALPGGLTLNSAGVLSGTPTAAGTFSNIIVRATNTLGTLDTAPFTITIAPTVTVTPASLPDWTINKNGYMQTIVGNNGTGAKTLTLTSGSIPTGLTFTAASGDLSGTPTVANTFNFTITATDTLGQAIPKSYSIVINPAIVVSPLTLPDWTVDLAGYSQNISRTGGTGASAFAISAGSLPPGLSLTSGGVLSGTPSATGTYNFTVSATDTVGATGAQSYTVVINPAILLAPTTLPDAEINTSYSQTITATGGTGAKTFSFTGILPTGLTLDSVTGLLSGPASVAGTFNFTVTATDTVNATSSQAYSVTISAITVSPNSLPNWTANAAGYSQTFVGGGGTAPYAFAVTAGALPSGLTLVNEVLSGTPTLAGTFNFTITATDSASLTGARTYSVVINPAITVSPASLPNWTVDQAGYSQTLSSSGGTGAKTFTVTAGALPAGLTLSSGGILSGTPTAANTFNFTVSATDTVGATGSQVYTVVINAAVVVTPATVSDWTVNQAGYNQALSNTGGTGAATFTVTTGALPTGLTLSTVGVLSGTPTAANTFNFTVTATDTVGATGSQAYTIVINPAVAVTGTLVDWTLNKSGYSQTLSSTGGTGAVTFAVTAGALPTGLTLSTAGVLSGTPTAANTFNFTVTATDTVGATGFQAYTVLINPVVAVTGTLVDWTLNKSGYNQALSGTGGTGAVTFAVTAGAAPTGLTLSSGGVLSGTPTVANTFNFTVTATDSVGATGSQAYTVVINPAIAVTPASVANWTVNQAGYGQTLSRTGGTGTATFAVTAGSLPTGLALSNAGVLSGTPTVANTFNFTITATDSVGATGSQAYSVVINSALTLTPTTLPDGVVYTSYNQTVATAGGTGAATFAVTLGALPTGLTINGSSGVLSGSPTATGVFNFTVTATDSVGATGQQAYTITTTAPNLVVTPGTLANATIGANYSVQMSTTGGLAPYTYSVINGALPAGLTLSSNGLLSGTPTASGTFQLGIGVVDSSTGTGPYNSGFKYSITVNAPTIALTPGTLPSANLGATYSQSLTATGGTAPYTFNVTAGALPVGLSLSTAGVISGTATAGGLASFTVTVTDSSTGTGPFAISASLTILVNQAPVLASAPTATPNPAFTNQPVQFSAAATDADLDKLSYVWNFQDGSTSTDQNPTHTFTAPGIYAVSVTVDDGKGGTSSSTVTLNVLAGALAGGDADKDGFADEVEAALGSDPFSNTSVPEGMMPVTQTVDLPAAKLNIQLNFAKSSSDVILLSGRLPAKSQAPAGVKIVVNVGGVVKSFVLSTTGRAHDSTASVFYRKGAIRNFRLKLAKGSFASALKDEELTEAAAKEAKRQVNVSIIFLGVSYSTTIPQLYTVRNGVGKTVTPIKR